MKRKTDDEEKLVLPSAVQEWADKTMSEAGAMLVPEFDRLAMDELRKHFKPAELEAPMVKDGKPTKRTRGENLIDWIKAHWTQQRKTLRLGLALVWLPTDGWYRSTPLTETATAARALRAVRELALDEAALLSDEAP